MTQRLLLLCLSLGLVLGLFSSSLVPAAEAQPAQQVDLRAGQSIQAADPPEAYPHQDRVEGSGKGMALLFWAFALAVIGGALFVVTRKNMIAAVMGMVGSFLGISAIYMMLYAHFLAVVQMLVYAGAIMVLFVFVIMILNRPEDDPVGPRGKIGKAVGGVALLYLFIRLGSLLLSVEPPNAEVAARAPALTNLGHDWGSTKAVGTELFTDYVFPFEAISILLLVAVVGAIAIARPLRDDDDVSEEGT
jgi:NADH-quinone oxidoreductase subunit J